MSSPAPGLNPREDRSKVDVQKQSELNRRMAGEGRANQRTGNSRSFSPGELPRFFTFTLNSFTSSSCALRLAITSRFDELFVTMAGVCAFDDPKRPLRVAN